METAKKITVSHLETGALHPLWKKYPNQTGPQQAYIEIDYRSSILRADWNGEIGNAVPAAVWRGQVDRFTIPADLTQEEINLLLDEVAEPASKLLSLYMECWDGNNYKCSWIDLKAAYDLIDEIQERCDTRTKSGGVWEPGDWLEQFPGWRITSDTDLDALEAEILEDIWYDQVTLDNLREYLEQCKKDVAMDE